MMENAVMASLSTKLWEMSQTMILSLKAKSTMSTTATQANAVKKSTRRIVVRGKIMLWTALSKVSSSRQQVRELPKPTSVSSWY
jgi:hypothetical protein